ncbi:hypothetical protein NM688_g8972 [Phlebia brevispora]|uniref:Uncharacterized protein n=1 Tax=Phlebia brevispora TaxID=194682 RepID=A0ACC1RMV8_9APHY|nr:hypothetical protein NM688_g8972 [Phlebia brevispora]
MKILSLIKSIPPLWSSSRGVNAHVLEGNHLLEAFINVSQRKTIGDDSGMFAFPLSFPPLTLDYFSNVSSRPRLAAVLSITPQRLSDKSLRSANVGVSVIPVPGAQSCPVLVIALRYDGPALMRPSDFATDLARDPTEGLDGSDPREPAHQLEFHICSVLY